eukprot:4971646-Pyramimonas_sp.AAC.2
MATWIASRQAVLSTYKHNHEVGKETNHVGCACQTRTRPFSVPTVIKIGRRADATGWHDINDR